MKFEKSYRPESYWNADGLATGLWANIKGDIRRQAVKKALTEGKDLPLAEMAFERSLSYAQRGAAGAVHPALMGGEYLPDYRHGEVEIARISMATIHRDVTSIRACPHDGKILYRVVDEYKTEYAPPFRSARLPLTMGRLIRFINTTETPGFCRGLVIDFLRQSIDSGHDWDSYEHFLTISSEFYPELGKYYDWRLRRFFGPYRRGER